jgi:hypothetical protein
MYPVPPLSFLIPVSSPSCLKGECVSETGERVKLKPTGPNIPPPRRPATPLHAKTDRRPATIGQPYRSGLSRLFTSAPNGLQLRRQNAIGQCPSGL